MKIHEIISETTSAGGVAAVAQPMTMVRRKPKKTKRKNKRAS